MPSYIPKEQLDAYRRWEAESFDPQPPEPEVFSAPQPVESEGDDSELVANIGLPTAEDIERIHNEAHQGGYQAGFEEGREEGYQAGLAAAESHSQRMAELATNLEAALANVDQAVADQILNLALEVAKQVLRKTVTVRRETLIPVIREALAALPLHHGHVTLHISPEDGEVVREALGEHFQHNGWRIVEDREMQAGGCFIQAGSSEVDASLETRWRRVVEAIGAEPGSWLEQP